MARKEQEKNQSALVEGAKAAQRTSTEGANRSKATRESTRLLSRQRETACKEPKGTRAFHEKEEIVLKQQPCEIENKKAIR